MSTELTQRMLAVLATVAVAFVAGPAAPPGAPLLAGRSAPPATAASGLPPAGSGVPGGVVTEARSTGETGYRWPLAGTPEVTRGFDPPARRWLPGHRGVDLASAPGAVVRAAGDGVVAFAGLVAGTGVVSVDHAGGLRTTYQPLAPAVAAGDRVRAGDPLGVLESGHAGCPQPACLHWGLRQGEFYLDPLSLLGLGRLRLLPRA